MTTGVALLMARLAPTWVVLLVGLAGCAAGAGCEDAGPWRVELDERIAEDHSAFVRGVFEDDEVTPTEYHDAVEAWVVHARTG